jgi:hypothetical protein
MYLKNKILFEKDSYPRIGDRDTLEMYCFLYKHVGSIPTTVGFYRIKVIQGSSEPQMIVRFNLEAL